MKTCLARLLVLCLPLLLSACGGNDTASPAAVPPPPPPANYTLNLTRSGSGTGQVSSIPNGIRCGTQCRATYPAGSVVELTAIADAGSGFEGWGGDCAAAGVCRLVMNGDRSVSARFVTLPPAPPPVAAKACDAYKGEPLSRLQAYEGLMHEHSSYSDGDPRFDPADYFRIARTSGYQFVGSSEHSDNLDAGVFVTLHASCDATQPNFNPMNLEYCFLNPTGDKLQKWLSTGDQARAASGAAFLGIRGFEWTSDVFGHINVYFSKNFTNAKTDLGYAVTMQTFWDWFTRDPSMYGDGGSATSPVPFGGGGDGLAHFNHPHDKCLTKSEPTGQAAGFCDWNDYAYIPAAAERLFGIEAYNDGNRDDRYLPYLARALDKGWRLSFIGSEDEHFGQYAVEERPKTVTLATAPTEDAFRAAWLARRTYALTPGQHLRIDFDAEGHPMGDKMACNTGAKIPLTVQTRNPDGSDFKGSLQLFSNGGKKIAKLEQASGVFQLPVEPGEHWYFVRVHGADGKSVAYVAPVWIKGR